LLYQHIYFKKKYFYNFTKKVINLKVIHKTLIVTNVELKRICTYPHQVFLNFLKMLLLRDMLTIWSRMCHKLRKKCCIYCKISEKFDKPCCQVKETPDEKKPQQQWKSQRLRSEKSAGQRRRILKRIQLLFVAADVAHHPQNFSGKKCRINTKFNRNGDSKVDQERSFYLYLLQIKTQTEYLKIDILNKSKKVSLSLDKYTFK